MAISKYLVTLAILMFLSLGAHAETIKIKPDAPDRYVVKKGDTLWHISARFLKTPWLWPEIWQVNPAIGNPHLIYPGDIIFLSYDAEGKPVLTLHRGSPTVKLSPEARPSRIDEAISVIPLDAIQQFLTNSRVVSKEEYDNAPYIVAFQNDRVMASTTDKAYVRGFSEKTKQSEFSVLRLGKALRNPGKNKEILGYETIEVAGVSFDTPGDPASFLISYVERETLAGDRLFPVINDSFLQSYSPHAPTHKANGKIIAVLDGVSRIGQYHVVVLNIGENKGMELGHVLGIYQSGRQVQDKFTDKAGGETVTLPDEHAGLVLVFRVFDKVSYALVMRAERDIKLYDRVANPE
ncbi:MAG: LysM peptidoglycan-binding domain-containing protein [Gammaproteobacteria bacterium]|nr:LysM peptidoglycan-binding domain-containing protein [Gammaproteobacteria bacterium]